MINIDTERLVELMNLLQQASNDIDTAEATLTSITTHDGWACKERYIINDYIIYNKKMIKTLQDEYNRFCRVAKEVSDDMVETESGISAMFAGVESALAAILSNSAKMGSLVTNLVASASVTDSKPLSSNNLNKDPIHDLSANNPSSKISIVENKIF